MVKGLAAAAKITATPTIRLNGEDINPATPDELIAKVRQIVGPLPALAPTPAPPGPARGRRVSNAILRAAGWQSRYPSYREAYADA